MLVGQRERGPEFVVVLRVGVLPLGVPWLERVYNGDLALGRLEMGAAAEVRRYRPAEFERKREQLKVVRETAEHGLELTAVA